jgi:hypothetical protein
MEVAAVETEVAAAAVAVKDLVALALALARVEGAWRPAVVEAEH